MGLPFILPNRRKKTADSSSSRECYRQGNPYPSAGLPHHQTEQNRQKAKRETADKQKEALQQIRYRKRLSDKICVLASLVLAALLRRNRNNVEIR